ncbi:uncharacterized protein N7506_007069 [Penicillium brevicompactum]|uniref:uncharacterized protein n=1 Tax=Penicillium brevicompactum TaxID=5074 RepID=UPI0025407237|nr:uncharacterized protein N7506_007069 [Penicillium brevicompactum]KAJ5333286.1 hypothetical protein N7506_007069 [Penicillium brevicompactum]
MPFEAFITLEKLYGQGLSQAIVQRFRMWNELRYKGSDAAGFANKFQKALHDYEETITPNKVFFKWEYAAFMTAIMSNPRCNAFVQMFKPTNAHAMYQEFYTSETTNKSIQYAYSSDNKSTNLPSTNSTTAGISLGNIPPSTGTSSSSKNNKKDDKNNKGKGSTPPKPEKYKNNKNARYCQYHKS